MELSEPRPDIPGWDWDERDFSWLSDKSGIRKNNVSIFFIHGGRIRHQGDIPYGNYPIEAFIDLLRKLSEGLDNPLVMWVSDTGGGDPGFWVEGTRYPNNEDLERLRYARKRQEQKDRSDLASIKRRYPEWFGKGE